jgi:hypothetical protein
MRREHNKSPAPSLSELYDQRTYLDHYICDNARNVTTSSTYIIIEVQCPGSITQDRPLNLGVSDDQQGIKH